MAAAAESGEGMDEAAAALAAAEAYTGVDPADEAGSSDGGASEGSGSEWEDAEGLQGVDREAAEALAVARAARRAAAAERAAERAVPQEEQQQQQQREEQGEKGEEQAPLEGSPSSPSQPSGPATPMGRSDSGEGGSSNGGAAAGSGAGQPADEDAAVAAATAAQACAVAAAGIDGTPRRPDTAAGSSGSGACDKSGSAAAMAAAAAAQDSSRAERRLARAEAEAEQKELFQAAVVRRKQRGLVQQVARQQAGWDREAWPRAAWWVRGLGCFGCEEMNECPVPMPFTPLGDFIHEVGREGTQEEIHTYLHRMREKGWDVGQTIEKLLRNGTRISTEAHEIVRIPGLLTDADMIGDLVWAWDRTTNCWWPCERIDPLAMPAGRDLPHGALRALTADEKLCSLPQYRKHAAKLTPEQRAESRRVLVLYMPISSGLWGWFRPADLEPFEGGTEREREATALIRSNGGRWKYGDEMVRALKDAKASLWIKQHRNCLEADRMRRTRASAAAGAINLKQRCGQCKTCMNNYAGQRRFDCLTQRMKAAALSGHAGAQVAINGEGAVGARVQVWWEGDQTFYSGILALYDAVSTEHTVCYDDGEVGMHRLWQHDERIRLASPVEQWPRDAALARQRLAAAQERLRSRDQGRRALGPAPPPPTAPPEGAKAAYVTSTQELRRKNREAFEVLFGSAVKGLEATGEVPELTAEEREVVATAQRAARAAAAQQAQLGSGRGKGGGAAGTGLAKAGGAGARNKGRGKRRVSSDAEEEGEAMDAAAAAAAAAGAELASPVAIFEAAEAAAAAAAAAGPSSDPAAAQRSNKTGGKRSASPPTNGGGEKAGKSGESPPSIPIEEALGLPPGKRARLEKCGQCKYCINPKLKKACEVVRMQRRECRGLR